MKADQHVASLFLAGARIVAAAVADPAVAAAWEEPSVLEEQSVGSLAGHLARGGVWVVADYLAGGPPSAPVDFESPAEYFSRIVTGVSADGHRAIRQRGAAVAAAGPQSVTSTLQQRLNGLEKVLVDLDPATHIAVIGGKVMRLEDYLRTRIVEQTVHLDDLARSIGREAWPLPAGAEALTLSVGLQIACRQGGSAAMIRALYRRGFAETTLPVI